MLGGGRSEDASYLANKGSFDPEPAGLIEKVAHLRGHVAKACGRSKDNRVIVWQLINARDWRLLVQLHARSTGDLFRDQLRDALDGHVRPRNRACAFSDGVCHLLDMTVAGIVENENFRH